MKLFNLYMERDGQRVPIGQLAAESREMVIATLPDPPPGVRYLEPVEVVDRASYEHARREFEIIAESSNDPEIRKEARAAAAALVARRSDDEH